MKKRLCFPCIVIFSMFLFGCGDTGEGQDPGNKVPDVQNETEITFPTSYDNTIGNVDFKMTVIVDTDLGEEVPITAQAKMLKVNEEQAFQLLFSDNNNCEVYSYEEKTNMGKK